MDDDDDDDPDYTDVGIYFKNDSEEADFVNLNNSQVRSRKLQSVQGKVVKRQKNKTLKDVIRTTPTLKLDATFEPSTEVDNASLEGISKIREGDETPAETDSLSRSIRPGKNWL